MGLRWRRWSLLTSHAILIINPLTIINKISIIITKWETVKYDRQQLIAETITIKIRILIISIWVTNKSIIRHHHHQSKY